MSIFTIIDIVLGSWQWWFFSRIAFLIWLTWMVEAFIEDLRKGY